MYKYGLQKFRFKFLDNKKDNKKEMNTVQLKLE